MLFELIPILKKHDVAAGWLMISFGIIGHGTNLGNTKTGMNKTSKFHQEMVRELQVFLTA